MVAIFEGARGLARKVTGAASGAKGRDESAANIAGIYQDAVLQGAASRNPVVVIPGILGSRLVNSEASGHIWGDFRKNVVKPLNAEDFSTIGIPPMRGEPLDQLLSPSQIDGSLSEVRGRFAGIPIRKTVYGSVLGAMGVGGYADALLGRDEEVPSYEASETAAFEFDYDWRRSLDESAIRFHRFLKDSARFLQAKRGSREPIRFDVVAHSMGGLLLRYYLQYGARLLSYDGPPRATWAGARTIDTAVIIGTPNAGSIFALQRLVSGLEKSPVHPAYPPTLIGSMPALYQLLPRSRHRPVQIPGEEGPLDLFDIDLWIKMGWGLASSTSDDDLAKLIPGEETAASRRRAGLEHLDKCLTAARSLHRALDEVPPGRPDHLSMHLIAGDEVPTPLIAGASPGDTKITMLRKAAGDGTVLRTSALLDERVGGNWVAQVQSPLHWDSVTFVPGNHLGITHHPVTINNVLYLLLERPRYADFGAGAFPAAGWPRCGDQHRVISAPTVRKGCDI